MNNTGRTGIAAALALMLAVYLPMAWADGCRTEDEKAAAVQMRKAEDSERAGKLKEAYDLAGKIDSMCLAGDGYKRHEAMRKRIGLHLGQQEEKQGRLGAAFDWYKNSRNAAAADRDKLKQVDASPRDKNLVSNAIDHFRFKNNDARVTELRQLAAKNAELELAGEDKAFAARKESFQELESAKDWFYLVGDGAAKKVRKRAERRGDTLLQEDTHRHLENAQRYFRMAEAKQKEKTLQDKALRLAQAHEKKGEITQAANFYNLAGAGAKGDELQKRTEAQHQKSEEKRQKQFSKDQDKLEKELGL
ncbi:MAG: hypothetical protein A2Z44_00125 [Betaproteobacteria bacterium RBG_19FT_COMBO_58_11]|nr:MAG: hypothetical protein A2Z44_00125 [Betaproteobacteria bacterium RBG_19FT_COMBO_58_11]